MIRTTLFLPEALHQQLIIESRRQGKSFSELAREIFRRGLAGDRDAEILKTYRGLDDLEGMADDRVRDASTTIDETLYGDNGVWRGSERNNDKP